MKCLECGKDLLAMEYHCNVCGCKFSIKDKVPMLCPCCGKHDISETIHLTVSNKGVNILQLMKELKDENKRHGR